MGKIKVMTIFGTRPEAIKMAPVVKELQRYPHFFMPIVAVTAQHREMLDQVLALFDIKPDYDLNIMQANQTLFDVTSKALLGLKEVLEQEKPDIVLVHGDTTTTFVGSLAAFYLQIPVGHVEAGLRTGNIYSPFPEEMNRKLTGNIAEIHFAPTATSQANLLREGVGEAGIYVTGNTVIDALKATVSEQYEFSTPELQNVDFSKRVILVTTHRRENLGEPMRQVYMALRQLVEEHADIEVVFPVHKNPKVRQVVDEVLGDLPAVHLIEPLDYEPFINLLNKSFLVMTDSGGLQEEAPSLGKPVLVLRDTTERPEALDAGTVVMVGTDRQRIYQQVKLLLQDQQAYQKMANAVNPYGDGLAAQRIVQALAYKFGLSQQQPEEYGV